MNSEELQILMIQKVPSMPNKAKRVAEYLLANMREAAFRSIRDVADELKSLQSSDGARCRMLGFGGYAELKDCLQNAILEASKPRRHAGKNPWTYRMKFPKQSSKWNTLI
jgi:transcriptional regulator, RpiR family